MSAFSLLIQNSLLECYSAYNSTSILNAFNTTSSTIGGALFVSGSKLGVTSYQNTYRNCYTASIGGIYTLTQTSMKDSQSSFYQNGALSGGAIKCDGCSMVIADSVFYDNQAGSGGVFLFDNQASMSATNIQLTDNSA